MNKHKPWLLVDVDGVLLDWRSGFNQFLTHTHPHLPEVSKHADNWRLSVSLGITESQVNKLVDEFHAHDIFAQLQPLPGVVHAWRVLTEWFSPVAITACGTQPHVQRARRRNLQQVLGDTFAHVHCTDTFAEKSQYLSMYPPSWWVEDHPENAQLGLAFGHSCMLMNQPYNQHAHDAQIMRVSSWPEAGMIMLSQLRSRFL